MPASTVPGMILKLGLSGVRLPLTIVQRAGERTGLDLSGLPPVAAYDTIEARAKQVLGVVLHDEELLIEGERQGSITRRHRGSQWMAPTADEAPDRADRQLEDPGRPAEEARREVEQEAAEKLAQIEREEEQARDLARDRARRREAAARQAARKREKAAEAKERQAELARARAEARVVEKQADALEAEKVVTAIDEHLESRKASRRNGSA